MPPRTDKKRGMEVQTLTPDEADASLMKEVGLSYDEMAGLNLYWKRLMLGWKEPTQRAIQAADPLAILKKVKTAPVAGGWRVPGR